MTGIIVRSIAKDADLSNAEISPEYFAGFFDGEGSITITVSGHYNMHVLRLIVTNTNLELIRSIQSVYGGKLRMNIYGKRKPNWKPSANLEWTGWSASDVLHILAPRLKIKKRQAELAIQFWEFVRLPRETRCELTLVPCKGMKNGTRSQWSRTSETRKIEQDFKLKMHALNKRGIEVDPTNGDVF